MSDLRAVTYVYAYCGGCGHEMEANSPRHSVPVKCPRCGKDNVCMGVHALPENLVWCDANPRQYNICGGEKQIKVYLRAATGEHCGVTFPPDNVPDCEGDPVEVGGVVLAAIDRHFLYYGGKEKVVAVVAAMKAASDLSDENRRVNELQKARKALVFAIYEYDCAAMVEEVAPCQP